MKAVLIRNQYPHKDKLEDMLGHLPDIEIVMQSDNVSDAPELCATYVPDMIIMDCFAKDDRIPGCVARIKQDFPGIKVFVLIGAKDDSLAYEAKEAGADVVARRNISPNEWRRLIRYVKKHYRVYLKRSTEKGSTPPATHRMGICWRKSSSL